MSYYRVDEEDKRFEMLPVSDSQNGNLVKTALINESGLYSLVLSSKLPSAKKFRRWVTSEVLPSIRKTEGYSIPKDYPSALRALYIKLGFQEECIMEVGSTVPQDMAAESQALGNLGKKTAPSAANTESGKETPHDP